MKQIQRIAFILILSFCSVSLLFSQEVKVGADRLDNLLPMLEGKKVALVINQTSVLSDKTSLLDTLLSSNVQIEKIFAPEHGFRGTADAGARIKDGHDPITKIKVESLYGKNYKPSKEQLDEIDIVVFDIQDVGARFYTYISTMHYVMEACAENGKDCIILDRPNPNDHVAGPVLEMKYKSFVGMHPIPVQHGLTVGELAMMINGEGWLANAAKCRLFVIRVDGWKHGQPFSLQIAPSPNLPNDQSIAVYPSLCFFEATKVSVGRGTDFAFQVAGAPGKQNGNFVFTPQSREGARSPMHQNVKCYGVDLRDLKTDGKLDISYLLDFYKKSGKGAQFFSSRQFMDMLSGSDKLRKQIINGETKESIEKSWEKDLEAYCALRAKYLLYPDKY